MKTPTVLALLIAAALVATAAPARAQKTAKTSSMTCEVVEIEASSAEKASIDPELKDLEKKLKKGPFSAYNKFVKSARIAKKLEVMVAEAFDTPKGEVTLIIREIDKPSKKRTRLSLGIQLETEAGKQYIDTKSNVDAGDFLMFARTVSDKQSIVTAVGCR
jgi:hypothetical protein